MMSRRYGLLALLLIVIVGTSPAWAGEAEDGLDAARQLVSPGWEEPGIPENEPVIAYGLRLVEFSARASGIFETAVELSRGQVQGGYTIVTDENVLSWVGGYPGTFKAEVVGVWDSKAAGAYYDTWLVTMLGAPTSIELSRDKIAYTDEKDDDQVFKMFLTPRQIDDVGERVMTDVALEYLSRAGTTGKTNITTWIRSDGEKPIAIVIQDLALGKESLRRCFGLYASAVVMDPRLLPESGPIVSIGSIQGLQSLLKEGQHAGTDEGWVEVGLVVNQTGGEMGYGARVELERQPFRAQAALDRLGSETKYAVGLDWQFYEELGLGVLLNQDTDSSAVLRLGLSDRVSLGEMVDLEAAYLPLAYKPKEGRLVNSPWLQFALKVKRGSWGMWYQGLYNDDGLGHGLGLSKKVSSNVEVRLLLARTPTSEDYLGLCFVWRVQ
ncbi:MAG: hypothetical protein GX322_00805 [Firmicutes bacterium]|nr:hypothetical protein [Bacillota bacterium]